MDSLPFHKVLVANRGEIACRIIRTCRQRGLETVAVFSDADEEALHVRMADEAVWIGAPPARDSYLSIDTILAAADVTGADAVHPGYGFLAENAEFAGACEAFGLTFIGPTPDAIRAMGLKDGAKQVALRAGVPILPGAAPAGRDLDAELAAAAAEIGYPVLLKAVAGGGGRGMRRVDTAGELTAAIRGAQREALNSFGDDRLLVEKFLPKARHIEVQVLADAHGNLVHLFERDCSLQRRHQKVVEEAPAPGMTPAMRQAMGDAAVRLARAVGYRGAGTVEFVADASDGLREDRFWFMEMNTRLQVEHPVTEAITGLDIVEQQLRIAAGLPLGFRQEDLAIRGHAIEVRLCAEDPRRNYLPSPGRLTAFEMPAGVRVETGTTAGDEVAPWYDNMLAKLIAHGDTRAASLSQIEAALAETEVRGVASNLDLLRRTVRHSAFRDAALHTGFLEQHRSALIAADEPASLAS